MDTNSGLRIGLLRVVVLLLFAALCYQFGYTSGSLSGDWKVLEDQIRHDLPNVAIGADADSLEAGPPAAATASNDAADLDTAG